MFFSILSYFFVVDKKFRVFALRVSGLGLIPSMRPIGRKYIQFVKHACSIFHSEFKAKKIHEKSHGKSML